MKQAISITKTSLEVAIPGKHKDHSPGPFGNSLGTDSSATTSTQSQYQMDWQPGGLPSIADPFPTPDELANIWTGHITTAPCECMQIYATVIGC